VTRSYAWRDSFICATWFVDRCDVTRSYVRHDPFMCVTWRFPCWSLWTILHATWLVNMWNMTRSHVRHDVLHVVLYAWPLTRHDSLKCVTWPIDICIDMCVWRVDMCVWLVHTCDMTCSHATSLTRSRLQHTATHCNTLQHPATHCNTLPHTATHCNALQATCCTQMCDIWLIRLWPADQIRRFVDYTSDRLVGYIYIREWANTVCNIYIYMSSIMGGG